MIVEVLSAVGNSEVGSCGKNFVSWRGLETPPEPYSPGTPQLAAEISPVKEPSYVSSISHYPNERVSRNLLEFRPEHRRHSFPRTRCRYRRICRSSQIRSGRMIRRHCVPLNIPPHDIPTSILLVELQANRGSCGVGMLNATPGIIVHLCVTGCGFDFTSHTGIRDVTFRVRVQGSDKAKHREYAGILNTTGIADSRGVRIWRKISRRRRLQVGGGSPSCRVDHRQSIGAFKDIDLATFRPVVLLCGEIISSHACIGVVCDYLLTVVVQYAGH